MKGYISVIVIQIIWMETVEGYRLIILGTIWDFTELLNYNYKPVNLIESCDRSNFTSTVDAYSIQKFAR